MLIVSPIGSALLLDFIGRFYNVCLVITLWFINCIKMYRLSFNKSSLDANKIADRICSFYK